MNFFFHLASCFLCYGEHNDQGISLIMRKIMFKKYIIIGTTMVLLTGAVTPSYAGDHLLGGLLGAAGGAAIGSKIGKGRGNIAAIAVGTLIGAGFGQAIASSSSYGGYRSNGYQQPYAPQPSYYGQPSGYYSDHHEHHRYGYGRHHQVYAPSNNTYVTQVTSYQNYQQPTYGAGNYCREYVQTTRIGGQPSQTYGTACLQPDGSWQIQN